MKKKLILLVFITVLVTAITTAFAEANIKSIQAFINSNLKVTFNGQIFKPTETDGTEINPIIYNGRTYLPIRAIADITGLGVKFDQATNTVVLTSSLVNDGIPTNDNTPTQSNISNSTIPGSTSQQSLDGITVTGPMPGSFNVKIDRTKLQSNMKSFTKVAVLGTDDISNDAIKKDIQDAINHGWGVMKYDEDKGYNESNPSPHEVLMFFDDNSNSLGFIILK